MNRFQIKVSEWMLACFGSKISRDRRERNFRFLEEALELVQSLGCTKQDALKLIDYVYARKAGDPKQEVGGVMLTLGALCNTQQIDMQREAQRELKRVWTKIEAIRLKQASKKDICGPLP